MSENRIPLERLEAVNDLLAAGTDQAGESATLFLAKVAYYLGTHLGEVSDVEKAIEISLRDL